MYIGSVRIFPYFLAFATCLHLCQTRSLGSESSKVDTSQTWQPEAVTMSEWLRCRGMPKDMCERTRNKYRELHEVLLKKRGLNEADDRVQMHDPSVGDHSFKGCMWLTEEQIDGMIAVAKNSEDKTFTGRRKRALPKSLSKWSMPIHYKFDGKHDNQQKSTIRNAFQHWTDNTCIRFSELETHAKIDDNHLLLTSRPEFGCHSYVGMTAMKPQPINLPSGCLERFGTPVHEIGHTLGLLHEQMRADRDSAINILWDNIYDFYWSQFSIQDTDTLEIPYNYGSVMHYSSKDTVSINGEDTMIALDPLYQMNMGQRTGLSFEDIKIINSAYCQGVCTVPLIQPCLRGGYQNPNNCSSCLCPEGFSGLYCEQVAPAKDATCGGELNIAPGTEQIIKSPGYDDMHHYNSHQECNWWIKAPEGYQLQMTFDGEFGLYSDHDACYHWVEIKYKKDLGLEGGRFCGSRRPNVTVISQSNEMMITFRSNYSVDYFSAQRGFNAIVRPVTITGDSTSTPAAISRASASATISPFSSISTTTNTFTTETTTHSDTSSTTISPSRPAITFTSVSNTSTANPTFAPIIISANTTSISITTTDSPTSSSSATTTSTSTIETSRATPEITTVISTSISSSISS